jgi:hypothetical protein
VKVMPMRANGNQSANGNTIQLPIDSRVLIW